MPENPYASPCADGAVTSGDAPPIDRNRRRLQVLRWLAAAEFWFFAPPAAMLALICAIARRSPLEALARDGLPLWGAGIYAFRLLVSYATYSAARCALAHDSRRAAWTTAVLASVPYVSPWGFVGLPIGWALCFSLRRAAAGAVNNGPPRAPGAVL